VSNYRRHHHDKTTRPIVSATWATDHARRCFADEIAIDFPSMGAVVERMRDELVGSEEVTPHNAAISVSRRDAYSGVTVPIDVPLRATCDQCGGRGETWAEPCAGCDGSGEQATSRQVRVLVPAGVSDGTRLRFVVSAPHGVPTRVEVTVLVA
jgi:hypothetical protein